MNDIFDNILPDEMEKVLQEAVRLSSVMALPGNKVNYKEVYKYFESNMKEYSDSSVQRAPIACRKGCSFCCYLKVESMSGEMEYLLSVLSKDQKENLDRNKIVERLEASKTMPASYGHAGKPCVFLSSSGTCSVYENRPLACRSMVVTNATHCEINHKNNTNGSLQFHKFPKLLMSALALAIEMITRNIYNMDALFDELFKNGDPPSVFMEEDLLTNLNNHVERA